MLRLNMLLTSLTALLARLGYAVLLAWRDEPNPTWLRVWVLRRAVWCVVCHQRRCLNELARLGMTPTQVEFRVSQELRRMRDDARQEDRR